MTFYQELQLNQAGSKDVIRKSENGKEKLYHIGVYLFKIAITVAFCFAFVAGYSVVFGSDNSVVGVVTLLCVMVFRQADFGANRKESLGLLLLFFFIMLIGPHAANQLGAYAGFGINVVSILAMMLLGCHNPLMSNHSTIVLGYLLLYGYDVTGSSYSLRVVALAVGCILTMIVFCRNHKDRPDKQSLKEMLAEFRMDSARSRWQISLVLCVAGVICISELWGLQRSMWAGIAAMSAVIPAMEHMKMRVADRIVGNLAGGICFLALYFLLPQSIYAYIGVLGGIGVGFSAKYRWQAVFNTFGALAIATEAFGLTEAVYLRVLQNVLGVVFALAFCTAFHLLLDKWQNSRNESDNMVY